MAEFPALPFWTDAYLGDTTHLTTIEHGAYILLLITAWRTPSCSLPNDDDLLARYAKLTRKQWLRMKPIILKFYDVSSGELVQHKLQETRDAVRQRQNSQRENARAKYRKFKQTSSAMAEPRDSHGDANQNQINNHNTIPPVVPPLENRDEPSRRTKIQYSFQPDVKGLSLCADLAVDAAKARAKFVDHHIAAGTYKDDWQAAFRNWARVDAEHAQKRASGHANGFKQQPVSNLATGLRVAARIQARAEQGLGGYGPDGENLWADLDVLGSNAGKG